MKKILTSLLCMSLILGGCATNSTTNALTKRSFILDWTPNTNHTGLYVAQEKGYFKEAGVDLTIAQPPEGSTTELIVNGKAEFGISFQDTLVKRFEKKAPITAIAAIIEHNTSGILSLKEHNIVSPKYLENTKYGTWNDPIELKMLESVMQKEQSDFNKVQLVPNDADNSVVGLTNKLFDSAWVYYAWDGILAEHENIATNFFLFKDFDTNLDYYSPVIIANNQYLSENKEEAQKIMQAIKKGYQYAMANPKEAADILMKYAPELKANAEFVYKSQNYISTVYTSNSDKWGEIDAQRWNNFYTWINDNHLVETNLELNYGFSNDYLGK